MLKTGLPMVPFYFDYFKGFKFFVKVQSLSSDVRDFGLFFYIIAYFLIIIH